jgi:hypothetical protein
MMAKMFYTLEETKATLQKSEEEIKQLTREGKLREFRDGPRLMFKADQVEAVRGDLGLGDQIDLGPSDTGGPLGFSEGAGNSGSGSVIGLADTGKNDSGISLSSGLAGNTGSMSGGSVGGVPSPGMSGSGISVLDDSGVDPKGQTAVSGSFQDQVNLEAMGSGSGLLDLSRDQDDTSLGAELLDEMPGGSRAGGSSLGAGTSAGVSTPPPMSAMRSVGAPEYIEAPDPVGAGLGAAALGASLVLLLGIIALAAGVMRLYDLPLMSFTADAQGAARPWFWIAGAGVVITVIFFVVGMVTGGKRSNA